VTAKEQVLASLGEGGLILTVGAAGWALHMPLIFTSLGPTAYELVEKPNAPSARTYNIIVGHFVALGAGFFSLWLLGAWHSPKVAMAGFVGSPRLWASVIAVVMTTALTLTLKASQPAALSTTLLVSLGSMQQGRDAAAIIIAVLLLAALGEPIRTYFRQFK
jgi:HPP family protein